jgi:hypothetical protein
MENSRAAAATATAATRADLLRNGVAAGAGFRCREAALGRPGGKRGYLRYVVGVQDTVGPSVGRADAPAVSCTRLHHAHVSSGQNYPRDRSDYVTSVSRVTRPGYR